MKRAIVAAVVLCAAFGCMGGTALADSGGKLVVGGETFNYNSSSVQKAFNGKVSYNGSTHKLTITDWTYKGKNGYVYTADGVKWQNAIYCSDDLTIVVNGDESTLALGAVSGVDESIAVLVQGNLTISGTGTLKCASANATTVSAGALVLGNLKSTSSGGSYYYGAGTTDKNSEDCVSAGVVVEGNVAATSSNFYCEVKKGVTVTGDSYGICCTGRLSVEPWCDVYAMANSGKKGIGIVAGNGILAKDGNVMIEAYGKGNSVTSLIEHPSALGLASCDVPDGSGDVAAVANTYDYTSEKHVVYNTYEVKMRDVKWTGSAVTSKIDSSFLNRKDYTSVTCSNNVNVGKGKAVVTGLGTHRGTVTTTFNIVPAVAVAKASAGKGSIRVAKWSATGGSGYKVQYKEKGTWTWKTAKKLNSPAAVTISKLKSGKAYQVRIVSTSSVGSTNGKVTTVTVK